MTAPAEYRSVTGEVKTTLPGVTIGGNFERMAQLTDKMAIVRSFAHTNSGHSGGTHYVMTGYDNRLADNGANPDRPFLGSIVSRIRGTNHPATGIPTYVRLGGIYADGPAFLGTAYGPFDPAGEARRNMSLTVDQNRLASRRAILDGIDTVKRDIDRKGLMEGLDSFEQQAFNLILSRSQQAFDMKYEDPRVVDRYGRGLGEQMLLARRLCESGCGFVTVNYGGWDMHSNIKQEMDRRGPEVDQAVSALIEDLDQRGMLDNVLLVVSGEFGRTPMVESNKALGRSQGRDHHPAAYSMWFAGGGFKQGFTFGETDDLGFNVVKDPVHVHDIQATILHCLGIDHTRLTYRFAGRDYRLTDVHGEVVASILT
jgi:hypothetical protein